MDFRKYATQETSELVGRLVSGTSEKVAGDLQALRLAFDAVTSALDGALASQSTPEYASEVAALADRLAAEAAARAEAASQDARRQAQASIDELHAALEQARTDRDAVAEQLRAAREQLDLARADASRSAAQRDVEAARSEKLSAALSDVTTDLQGAKAQNKNLLERTSATAADLEASKKSSEEHERAAGDLQARLDAAVAEAEGRQAHLAAEQHRATCERASLLFDTSLECLLALYISVSDDTTIDAALSAVVQAMHAQFSRVALFRVQSNRLEGVRHVGFDLQGDISQVLIPRTLDSLATQAATSGRIETRSGGNVADASGMPFGGAPRFALALPLVIDGEPLAVVYADDSDQLDREFASEELRLKFAQLLQQQVLPMLARLVARGKALAELEQYAALLLTELEQTYTAQTASSADLPEADRHKHLREDIDYARRLYAERAQSEGAQGASLFEQRLFAAVETRGDTPFGRDIAAAIGARRRAAKSADSQTAGQTHSAAS